MQESAITHSGTASSIYEQLESTTNLIESIASATTDRGAATELSLVTTKLKALLVLFDEEDLLPVLASQLSIKTTKSKVERLGLSKEVIRLATQSKLSAPQIAEHFAGQGIDLVPTTILRFLKAYESSTYAEKVRSKSTSVFDTSEQLERLLSIVNTQLSKLAYSIDPKQQENHKGYVGELRQLIKLAADLQRSVQAQIEQSKFQSDIRYILLSVCTPDQQRMVLDRLRQYGSAQFEPTPGYSSLPDAIDI